jgi:hypothetical protein
LAWPRSLLCHDFFSKNSIGVSDKISYWPRCLGLGMLTRVYQMKL